MPTWGMTAKAALGNHRPLIPVSDMYILSRCTLHFFRAEQKPLTKSDLMFGSVISYLMNPVSRDDSVSTPILIIRVMVGLVFVSEGIQKFLFAQALGVGRFAAIGIPWPSFTAPFVGTVEIVCGTLIVLGLFMRLACIPVLISMTVAITSTKLPMLIHDGFWKAAHEARVDWAMILGLIFRLMMGAGRYSLDHRRFGAS